MNSKILFLFISLALVLGGCSRDPDHLIARRISAVENGLIKNYGDPPWKRMDLEERMDHYQVPGVGIALINDFQIEWARGYGLLQAGGSDPVTVETLFQAASIGKPIVSAAALKFVENGDLELDRDAGHYLVSWELPETEYTAVEKVTLRRLLSHTAGITVEWFPGYGSGADIPDLTQILAGVPPANTPPVLVDLVPGTQFRYSGGGFMVVQQILEDTAGQPLQVILQEEIFQPSGMNNSTFISPLPEDLENKAASGHLEDGSIIPGRWHIYPEMGSGASMWSTPSDLAKFAIQIMKSYLGEEKSILSQEMAQQMLTPHSEGRGLDFELGDDGGDRFYFLHPGGNHGFKSILVAYPERGQGLVIMTNGENGDQLWREILNSVSVEYGFVRSTSPLIKIAFVIVTVIIGIFSGRYFLKKKGSA